MAKVLLGFMGSGKTTIARLLDDQFVDMDAVLVERLGMPITQFFEEEGEAAFRKVESQVLAELLPQDIVLSTGGGVVMSAENRALLAQNTPNIFLTADFETLYQRLRADQEQKRPLVIKNSKETLRALWAYRQPLYEEVATQVIDVAGQTPAQIVEMIQ
ncbi:shikimate kinase [Streptococcus rupicaprae]|uniref:Shikimate kinase n=1 Tax=Streptococcus rupicaprae TaxID=759619 RepID=A0ABV2FEV2_9STRE